VPFDKLRAHNDKLRAGLPRQRARPEITRG
jgi:hypothetical protein